jgi:hypothetical protein
MRNREAFPVRLQRFGLESRRLTALVLVFTLLIACTAQQPEDAPVGPVYRSEWQGEPDRNGQPANPQPVYCGRTQSVEGKGSLGRR